MKLTAKDAADRLGVSYVIAAGILSHLEDAGKVKVVEKRFHASGRGKPTRVYEVPSEVALNFGSEVVSSTVDETVVGSVTEETVETATVEATTETAEKIETLDHVAAAVARLKQDAEAA